MLEKDIHKKIKLLKEAAAVANTEPEQLPAVIKKLKREIKEMDNEIKKF